MDTNYFLDYVTLFFLQYIPNAMIYILAGYAYSKKTIDLKKYILSSALLAIFGFTAKIVSQTKLLNISNTFPQVLIIFICIFLLVNINKIKIVKAIISSLSIMILQLIFEGIYILVILKTIFKFEVENIFEKSVFIQSVLGFPNLISLLIIVILVYKFMMKRRIQ